MLPDIRTLCIAQESLLERHTALISERVEKRRRTKQRPFEPSVQDVHDALMGLNGSKGLGKDSLSATILQAGEWETGISSASHHHAHYRK